MTELYILKILRSMYSVDLPFIYDRVLSKRNVPEDRFITLTSPDTLVSHNNPILILYCGQHQ